MHRWLAGPANASVAQDSRAACCQPNSLNALSNPTAQEMDMLLRKSRIQTSLDRSL